MKLPFSSDVRLFGDASPDEIVVRLQAITAPPFSFARQSRAKALRGSVQPKRGYLRWPFNQYHMSSARILHFDLVESSNGSVMQGTFLIQLPLRIFALVWVAFDVVLGLWTLVQDLRYKPSLHTFLHDVVSIALGLLMLTAYMWVVVFFGKRRDMDLVRVLRIVLASAEGANTTNQLLSRSPGEASFIDLPFEARPSDSRTINV